MVVVNTFFFWSVVNTGKQESEMMLQEKTSRLKYLHNLWKMNTKKKSVKYGLPFLIFMVGGSVVLKEWTQVRYQFAQVKGVSNEEAEKMGLHRDKKVTLEEVYDEIKTLDIDNWENKRGPRPWENTEQKQ